MSRTVYSASHLRGLSDYQQTDGLADRLIGGSDHRRVPLRWASKYHWVCGGEDVEIAVATDDDGLALESLYHWLAEDDGVARSAEVRLKSTPGTGRMGALDVIDVTLTHMAGLASLILAYANWRHARAETVELSFTINDVTITIRDAAPETVERILALARQGES